MLNQHPITPPPLVRYRRTRSSATDLEKRQGEASDLLAAGFASAEAASQLAAKHQVSRRTAQRWVLEGLKDLSLAGHGNNAVDSSELAQLRLLALRLYRKSVDAGNFNAGVGALNCAGSRIVAKLHIADALRRLSSPHQRCRCQSAKDILRPRLPRWLASECNVLQQPPWLCLWGCVTLEVREESPAPFSFSTMATHTQIPHENLSAWYFAVRWSRTNLEATIEKAEAAGLSCKYDRDAAGAA
jgi:hypothetical protein